MMRYFIVILQTQPTWKALSTDDLLAIANWVNDNKLTLDVDMTISMLIGSNFRIRKVNSMSVSVCDTEVEGVESFKYLGIVLCSNITWSEHVERVIPKVNRRLGLLGRIKHLLP